MGQLNCWLHKALHPRDNTSILYVIWKEGGLPALKIAWMQQHKESMNIYVTAKDIRNSSQWQEKKN